MAQTVTIDEKGRVVLPREARIKAHIETNSKLLVEVRGYGIIELRDYNLLSTNVHKVAAKKLARWREEDHKEDKLMLRLSRTSERKNANH